MNLQVSEDALDNILENSSSCMAVFDSAGRFVKGTQHFHKMHQNPCPSAYSIFTDLSLKRKGCDALPQSLGRGEMIEIRDLEYNPNWLSENLPEKLPRVDFLALGLCDTVGSLHRIVCMYADRDKKERRHSLEAADNFKSVTCGVAHDLNNLLFGISGQVECMLEELEELQTPPDERLNRTRKNLKQILDISASSAELISDLVMFAMPAEYPKNNIPLNGYIEGLGNGVLRSLCESKKVALEIHADSHRRQELRVSISERCLTRALINLVCNAVDAEAKTVKVKTSTIQFDEPKKAYEVIPPGQYAVIEFADDGKGIDSKALPHIFENCFSAKAMTKKSGTGLGLAVVRSVVQGHKGFVDVSSQPGKGTQFRIYLPASQ